MGYFLEIGKAIDLQNVSNKLDMCHYLPVSIAQTVFCEGKVVISTLAESCARRLRV